MSTSRPWVAAALLLAGLPPLAACRTPAATAQQTAERQSLLARIEEDQQRLQALESEARQLRSRLAESETQLAILHDDGVSGETQVARTPPRPPLSRPGEWSAEWRAADADRGAGEGEAERR